MVILKSKSNRFGDCFGTAFLAMTYYFRNFVVIARSAATKQSSGFPQKLLSLFDFLKS